MFFFFWWGARVTEGIGLHPALSSVALLKTQENWYLIDRDHAAKYKLTLLDPAITNTKSTIWHSSQSTSSSKMNNHTTKEISTPHFNCWNTATLFHASSPRQWKLTSSKWNQNYNFTTVLPMHLDHVTQFISEGSHDCDFQVIKEISK